MPFDHSIKGERYIDCDLCGYTYRYSDTTLNAGGLRVCREKCLDEGPWDPVYRGYISKRYTNSDLGVLITVEEEDLSINGEYGEVVKFDRCKPASQDNEYGVVTNIPESRV